MSRLVTVRPSQRWRDGVDDETRRVADGSLAAAEAFVTRLYPDAVIEETDAVLGDFATRLHGLADLADATVLSLVETTVLSLNDIHLRLGSPFESSERDDLVYYLIEALEDRGVDVVALMARQGRERYELTDEWRDW